MGRYTGSKCALCRRLGIKLFLKGKRCSMVKCAVDKGRAAPGMHGQRSGRKLSDYGVQLREKQRLRRQFGLRERQFRTAFERARKKRGVTGEALLQLLEMRLDSLVYRLGFAVSRGAARQFVRHGHVAVDGRKVDIPSMNVRPGSVIQVRDRPQSRVQAQKSLESLGQREMPPWIEFDAKNLSGRLLRIPSREEIAPVVDEQLVVELYSK